MGRGEVNVCYVCMPSTTATTTAADSCSPNAVVFRRSLRLRERKRENECERESATGSEIRAGQLATSNAKLSWPGVGRQLRCGGDQQSILRYLQLCGLKL